MARMKKWQISSHRLVIAIDLVTTIMTKSRITRSWLHSCTWYFSTSSLNLLDLVQWVCNIYELVVYLVLVGAAMFLLYNSKGYKVHETVSYGHYINDMHTTACSAMLGHHNMCLNFVLTLVQNYTTKVETLILGRMQY